MAECTPDAPTTIRKTSAGECLSIGGISLALSGGSSAQTCLSAELEVFRTAPERPDIAIEVDWQDDLEPWPGNKVFESGAVWRLFRDRNELIFDFTSYPLGLRPYKRLRVTSNFRSGQLTLNRALLEPHAPVCPLEYPADELLFTNYLATGIGAELHGCGLIDQEIGGQLLLGHSGAGKSTTAHLWRSSRRAAIISDDRIILRLDQGSVWMYGTPWHGEARFASPERAKLDRIFVLAHGDKNHILTLPKARAVGELFARSFPPFHSVCGLGNTLEFFNAVVNKVPCYEFRFTPDLTAVAAVLAFHD